MLPFFLSILTLLMITNDYSAVSTKEDLSIPGTSSSSILQKTKKISPKSQTNYQEIEDRYTSFIKKLLDLKVNYQDTEEYPGKETPKVFEELLDCFASFTTNFPFPKNRSARIKFSQDYLPSFTLSFRFFTRLFYFFEDGFEKNFHVYFNPIKSKEKSTLSYSSYWKAAHQFHFISNKVFSLIAKHYPVFLSEQTNTLKVGNPRAKFTGFAELISLFQGQLDHPVKQLEWEQLEWKTEEQWENSANFIWEVWKKLIEEDTQIILKEALNIFWRYKLNEYSFVCLDDNYLIDHREEILLIHPLIFQPPTPDVFLFIEGRLTKENGIVFSIYPDTCELALAACKTKEFQALEREIRVCGECFHQKKQVTKCDSCCNDFEEIIELLFCKDSFSKNRKIFIPIPEENKERKKFQYFQEELLKVLQKVQSKDFFDSLDSFSKNFLTCLSYSLGKIFNVSFPISPTKEKLTPIKTKNNLSPSWEAEASASSDSLKGTENKFVERECFSISSEKKEIRTISQSFVSKKEKTETPLFDISLKEKETKKRLKKKLTNKLEYCENSLYSQKSYKGLERLIYGILALEENFKKIQKGSHVKLHSDKGTQLIHIEHNNGKKKVGKNRVEIKKIVKSTKVMLASYP